MICPNCFGDGSVIIGEQDPQRDHPTTCPACKGRRKVPDTPGVRLCRAFHDHEPDDQETEADMLYLYERTRWDYLAETAAYVQQVDAAKAGPHAP